MESNPISAGIETKMIEGEAHLFLSQEKYYEAFVAFRKAGNIYKRQGNSKQAALCFASAASSWSMRSGEKTFARGAASYEEAAKEAEKTGDLEYASLLYKYAAINYEKDMEFDNYSTCFYRSKELYRKFLVRSLIHPGKINSIAESQSEKGLKGVLKRIFVWFVLTFSYLVWGHGERPSRTFVSGMGVVLMSAFSFTLGQGIKDGIALKPDFFEALYFSVITFTTVGYGDIIPTGFTKGVVMIEAICGLFLIPLFIIGLARKYLRV